MMANSDLFYFRDETFRNFAIPLSFMLLYWLLGLITCAVNAAIVMQKNKEQEIRSRQFVVRKMVVS